MTLLKRLRHTFLRRQKGYSKKRPLLAEFLEARSMLSALTGFGYRKRGAVGVLAVIAIALAALAVSMVYLKPTI